MNLFKKNNIVKLGIGLVMVLVFSVMNISKVKANTLNHISIEVFYNELQPYGDWIYDPAYGDVWVPHVNSDFRPYYTNGYWVNTDMGNMWMSDFNWGWAAFHYGRWTFKSQYGWVWVPGTTWAPAWVTWRQGGGYYGWAPMGPGVSISFTFGAGYMVPDNYWTFIPYHNLYAHDFYRYYTPHNTTNIIYNTTVINNTYVDGGNTYVAGPSRREIKATTGRDVRTYQVSSSSTRNRSSIRGNEVAVYRPSVQNSGNSRREVKSDLISNGRAQTATNSSATRSTRATTPSTRSNTAVTRNNSPATSTNTRRAVNNANTATRSTASQTNAGSRATTPKAAPSRAAVKTPAPTRTQSPAATQSRTTAPAQPKPATRTSAARKPAAPARSAVQSSPARKSVSSPAPRASRNTATRTTSSRSRR